MDHLIIIAKYSFDFFFNHSIVLILYKRTIKLTCENFISRWSHLFKISPKIQNKYLSQEEFIGIYRNKQSEKRY